MIVAIAIAAVVMGVGAPAMQRLYQSSRYHGAVNDVVALLSTARYTAIHTGKEADVLVYPESRTLGLGKKSQTLPANVKIEVLGSRELNREGAGVIRFYPDGGSSGGAINLLTNEGQSVQVQVDWLVGRVSLCKNECSSL